MKKGLKKFTTLGLAFIMAGATFGFAGCEDENEIRTDPYEYKSTNTENAYIVVSENGTDTLHKGDVIERAWYIETYKTAAMTPVLKFNCGKELQTSQFVVYYKNVPEKEKFDKACDCAYELTLANANTKNDYNISNCNPVSTYKEVSRER